MKRSDFANETGLQVTSATNEAVSEMLKIK